MEENSTKLCKPFRYLLGISFFILSFFSLSYSQPTLTQVSSGPYCLGDTVELVAAPPSFISGAVTTIGALVPNTFTSSDTLFVIIPFGATQGASNTISVTKAGTTRTSSFIVHPGIQISYPAAPNSNSCINSPSAVFSPLAVNPPASIASEFTITGGVSINVNSGDITPSSAGSTGPFTVTYMDSSICNDTSTAIINLTPADDVSFNYSSVCDSSGTNTLTPTGSFTTPSIFQDNSGLGLVFTNPSTGTVDVLASSPGVHTVEIVTSGTCPDSGTGTLTIHPKPIITLDYPTAVGGIICTSDNSWNEATITHNGSNINPSGGSQVFPGSFALIPNNTDLYLGVDQGDPDPPGGGSSNAATEEGAIRERNIIGNWQVVYTWTDANSCTDMDTFDVNVIGQTATNLAYAYDTTCFFDTNVVPTTVSPAGLGTFSSQSGNLFVDPNSGEVTVNSFYIGQSDSIVYTVASGCGGSSAVFFEVLDYDDASFSYPLDTFCASGTAVPAFVNTPGGSFFSSAGNITFTDTTTGLFGLGGSNGPGGSISIGYQTAANCPNVGYDTITILPIDSAGFSYPVSSVCAGDAPVYPIVQQGGGIFSKFSGSGFLDIDGVTGRIDPWTSAKNNFQIQYLTTGTCPDSSVQTLQVVQQDSADITYPQNQYCQGATNPVPTIFNNEPGTFSEPLNQIKFTNANTGVIDLGISTIGGPFLVTFITSGCADTSVFLIEIFDQDSSLVIYPDNGQYCERDDYPTPTLSGTTGGTFISTDSANFPVDSLTGQITLDLNPLGAAASFNVIYTTAGTSLCPFADTIPVTVRPQGDASFTYLSTFCESDSLATPASIVQSGPGTYFTCIVQAGSDDCDSLVLDTVSGNIFPDLSVPGTYTLQHYVPGVSGGCPATFNSPVSVIEEDTARIDYLWESYCESSDPDKPIFYHDDTTGIFTASLIPGTNPNGSAQISWISNLAGLINFTQSDTGSFAILFQIPGPCRNEWRDTLTIYGDDNASFFYPNSEYCEREPNPTAIITGETGGQFSVATSTPGLVFTDIDSGTVDLSLTPPNFYEIQYETSGRCPQIEIFDFVVNEKPEPILEPDPSLVICENELLSFDIANVPLGVDVIEFLFFINDSLEKQSEQNFFDPAVDMIPPYTLQDSDKVTVLARYTPLYGSCGEFDSVFVSVNPTPVATVVAPPTTITGDQPIEIQLSTSADSTRFYWEMIGLGRITPTDLVDSTIVIDTGQTTVINPSIFFLDDITPANLVFLIQPVAQGCVGALDSVTLNINPFGKPIFVPGVITPNGDGRNDVWRIQFEDSLNSTDYRVELYNRGGGLVYELDQIPDPMTFDGAGLPDGVYWYILSNNVTGLPELNGGLTIRRKTTGPSQ